MGKKRGKSPVVSEKPKTAYREVRVQQTARIEKMEKEIQALRQEVAGVLNHQPVLVPIATLAPEPFELIRDIPVVVQPVEDGFIATFFDANVSISGDTQEEAVSNLKELIVDLFDSFEKDEAVLGPGPIKQLAALREFLRRCR